MMAAPEDKEFSFLLRDRLTKYCDDNSIDLSHESPKHKMLLDMIVYCSMGDEEQGIENVKETYNFLMATWRQAGILEEFWALQKADALMWEFWKSCFIRVKIALASGKQEQIEACKDFARHPRGYAAHVGNFVGSMYQLQIYLEEQTRIWANDSQEVNNSIHGQE